MGFPLFVLQLVSFSRLAILSTHSLAQEGPIDNPAKKDALHEGPIPTTQTLQSFGPASFSGNSPISVPLNDTNNNEVQNTSSDKNNNSNILLILNVVLLLAIILLLLLYFNSTRKLKNIVKGQIPSYKEEGKDVEISVDKKIEIGEGTIMTVEERKELIFFSDKPKFRMGELLLRHWVRESWGIVIRLC